MNTTKFKSLLASKTIWTAIIAAVLGGYRLIAPSYHWDIAWMPGAEFILGAFGLYGLRVANTTLTPGGLPPVTPTPPDNIVPSPAPVPAPVPQPAPQPIPAPLPVAPPLPDPVPAPFDYTPPAPVSVEPLPAAEPTPAPAPVEPPAPAPELVSVPPSPTPLMLYPPNTPGMQNVLHRGLILGSLPMGVETVMIPPTPSSTIVVTPEV